MKQVNLTVAENTCVAENTFRMRLAGDVSAVNQPGQFVNIRVEEGFLRRPISVCDRDDTSLVLLYRAVGRGTAWLSMLGEGKELDVLTGLGNGFDLSAAGEAPLLVGGGIGAAPLCWLARELRGSGLDVAVALGFRTGAEVFCEEEFRSLGCRVTVATEDGTRGEKGLVTGVFPPKYSYIYACGPGAMLRAVDRASQTSGQFSLEERMGCGFGACMGCTCETSAGSKRVCRDGPVFRKEELPWQT